MIELVRFIAADKDLKNLVTGLKPGGLPALVTGLSGSARRVYFAALHLLQQDAGTNSSLAVMTHSMTEAEHIWEDLRELLPEVPVLLFPERELAIADVVAYSRDVMMDRLRTLQYLATENGPCIVVATLQSAVQPIMKRSLFEHRVFRYELGATLELNDHIQELLQSGYERVDMVESHGQFSVRGGILDIFPLTLEQPVRIEMFDSEIDSIRSFDPNTQRSIHKYESLSIGPAMDFLVPPARMKEVAGELHQHLERRLRTVTDLETRERMQSVINEDIHRFDQGLPFVAQLRYTQLLQGNHASLMEYLPGPLTVVFDEPTRLQERQKVLEREFGEWLTNGLMRGELLSGAAEVPHFDELWNLRGAVGIEFSMFARTTGPHRHNRVLSVTAKTMQQFHGQMNVLKAEMQRWLRSHTHIVLLAATEERAERLERVLQDYRIAVDRLSRFTPSSQPMILVGNLTAGFELPMNHLVVVLDTEVFSAQKKGRRVRSDLSDAERIKSYQELHPGDYVVHVNHGIGRYLGIETLEIDGRHKDYLHLRYAGNDSLYVPVEQIDQVQRYIGSEDKEPKVYHLGGNEWNRVKQKVSKSVHDIAEDLVKLYAARESAPGHGFAVDTPWQKDFDSLFPYEETPDQLRCIEDIRIDMEKPRPMDRLLCGDVGYGKTEVAIRAAFKAVMDDKQVAVLVPTTILAHQHYETFKERFAGFPVTIEMLSRFRTRKEASVVVNGLKDGSVDIVIGTHRILQKNLQFKDLGLLIVDEEQRFGVTHKEQLKQIKTNVDCLTLTATPIPRTLHMSLLGVRDLSVIETPPENRFPVQTYVVEYNDALVREALERELSRGGQVYVLYNQVSNIHRMAERVQELVPDATVATAHGQMPEDELERVMLDFLDGTIDVLVTTTIIETGLDIPNVNTLVVYDADRLGLSQLYQLRGRVGRSHRIAYAYFTYQRDKVLTEVAEKRLQAIKEFTELGSGFKIAMRDLAIRGAGNLLGAEQHGFINSVGFDMYNDMLSQAVKEIRGEKVQEPPEPMIDLALEAYLPDDFISDTAQKIAMYKKFKYVRSLDGADDLEEELEDRFGDLPDAVRNLLDITRIKGYALRYGVESVTREGGDGVVRVRSDAARQVDPGKMFGISKVHAGDYRTRSNGMVQVAFRLKGLNDRQICAKFLRFFRDYEMAVRPESDLTEKSQVMANS